jgi:DNA polymerase III alpha subunit
VIEDLKNNPYYLEEMAVINAIPDGQAYYEHIIQNVEIDRSNPNNSYAMYIAGKVDVIDPTKPCNFVEGATSLPDIDTDFPTDYREIAIEYVKNKYGLSKVCQIATFGRLAGRSAIKAVLRAEGTYDYAIMNAITEKIPDEAAISDQLEEMDEPSIIMWVLENKPELVSDYCYLDPQGNLSGDFADVFREAIKLEGTLQNQGKHAAGLIIASEDIRDNAPLLKARDGSMIAAMDMGDLEKLGLVKFDFLGVDILNKIAAVMGVKIIDIPLNDGPTWDMIGEGRTKGCFQIESHLGRGWAKELKPRNIEDTAALVAIIRPGTLLAKSEDGRSMTKVFCDRKNGLEELSPEDPLTGVNETFNVIIYQETILKIARELAGFNSADAIKLMKSVGKKDAKLLFSLEDKFLKGCTKTGRISDASAKHIFDQIKKSARYAFNKSHSVGYSYPAYWSAYIKCHFPLQFYKEWMQCASHKLDPHLEMKQLMMSARIDGIDIIPPSVKHLERDFFIRGNSVHFGLSSVKAVSDKELDKLFELIKEKGGVDACTPEIFLLDIFHNVNKRTIENLIEVGGFDYTKWSRSKLKYYFECLRDLTDKERYWLIARINPIKFNIVDELLFAARPKKEGGAAATSARVPKILAIVDRLKNPGRELHDIPSVIASREEQLTGATISVGHMDDCLAAGMADASCADFMNGKKGKYSLIVEIKEVKRHIIKQSGKEMAFLVVADDSCEIENVVCFADKFEMYSDILFQGNNVAIFGEVSSKGSFAIERAVTV